MISELSIVQMLSERAQPESVQPAAGEGFLEALLSSLPPELQSLSPRELQDWLHEQGRAELAALVAIATPAQPSAAGIAAAARTVGDEAVTGEAAGDPAALLGFIANSRGQLSGQASEQQLLAEALAAEQAQQAEQTRFAERATLERGGLEAEGPEFNLLLQAQRSERTGVAAEAERPLSVPVRHSEFGQAVGERLLWLVRNDVQQATIRLDPPELGPLEISIAVKDNQAAITLQAQHAVTREVLEAELPRLRGMLGESGFTQVDVDVARDQSGWSGGRSEGGGGAPRTGLAAVDEQSAVGAVETRVRVSRGLIDQYV